ncbi:MAG: sugar-binding protein, partial [Candidatus Omnitrophica bacterium]|nr:sugar-binding protein [Candidatus Omnitrophota bacterium]
DLSAMVWFSWDENALYFFAKIKDDSLVFQKSGANIWKDDLFEIFVDPEGDGLDWQDKRDFQIGFRPDEETDKVAAWSWFQGGEDPIELNQAVARSFVDPDGYSLEGAIRWRYLNITPKAGMEIRLSPAVHDIDRDRSEGKLQWFFRNEDGLKRFALGKVVLEK